jgi:hypothetical protein
MSTSSVVKQDYLSPAAWEAFELLKAATKEEYRVWGDTKTAARNRAAQKAGVTPAQAERLWKTWRTVKFPNGDVYRNLRNKYGHLCSWIEDKAEAIEREAQAIEESHAVNRGALASGQSSEAKGQG